MNALAHLIQLAGLAGIVLGAGFCLVAGDRPIASATLSYLLALIVSLVVQTRYPGLQYGVMAVDAAYLIMLLAISLRWRRQWTLWASAFQLLAVLTHLALLSQPFAFFIQYLTLLALWSYLVMVAICVGAGMAWQRRRTIRRLEAIYSNRDDVSTDLGSVADVREKMPIDTRE